MNLSPDDAAQLQTYGQLAVGFAGFAGVIGVFSRFRIHPQATAFRIRAMVVIAVTEVVFSLAPTMIARFGISETTTWRVSAGTAAVVGTAVMLVVVRHLRRLYRAGHLKTQVFSYVFVAAYAAMTLPLFAAALGYAQRYTAALYFAQLFFGMVVCSYYFVMLMIAVRLDDSP
jgi:hypothetical protein